jgi:hypothetical protein
VKVQLYMYLRRYMSRTNLPKRRQNGIHWIEDRKIQLKQVAKKGLRCTFSKRKCNFPTKPTSMWISDVLSNSTAYICNSCNFLLKLQMMLIVAINLKYHYTITKFVGMYLSSHTRQTESSLWILIQSDFQSSYTESSNCLIITNA